MRGRSTCCGGGRRCLRAQVHPNTGYVTPDLQRKLRDERRILRGGASGAQVDMRGKQTQVTGFSDSPPYTILRICAAFAVQGGAPMGTQASLCSMSCAHHVGLQGGVISDHTNETNGAEMYAVTAVRDGKEESDLCVRRVRYTHCTYMPDILRRGARVYGYPSCTIYTVHV